MHVIGTAGHVDHGKSTLIRALTGIDPDRLKEEKERGMTIDLGFAWLTLPSGREVGIVDVPGHQRFVKNMLAGVGGIDLTLFVVAANEGWMPQSREHLAIVDLLGVERGLVVLTKKDLVDDEWLEMVIEEVEEHLTRTSLAAAPRLAVSAVTGEHMDRLVAEIDAVLAEVPPAPDHGRPRLWIDRVFSIRGAGTVVTGTLLGGGLQADDEVEVLPRGVRARVRSLQTHKRQVSRAVPGSRVAVNLVGVDTEDLQRGDVLCAAGQRRPTRVLNARFRALADLDHEIPERCEVKLYLGAAEIPATLRVLGRDAVLPGDEADVQLVLAQPTVAEFGDRYILRDPARQETVGGGRILDPEAYRVRGPRMRLVDARGRSLLEPGGGERFLDLDRLAARAGAGPEELVGVALAERGLLSKAELPYHVPLARDALAERVRDLAAAGRAVDLPSYVLSPPVWESLAGRIRRRVADYHAEHPLRSGPARESVRTSLGMESRLFDELVGRLAETGGIVTADALLRLPEHAVRFAPSQEQQIQRLWQLLLHDRYAPPVWEELVGPHGFDPELLAALVDQGRLVRVSRSVVFPAEVVEEVRQRIARHLDERGSIDVAEVRDLLGTSRKYALPLMEYFDEVDFTRRVGDRRVLASRVRAENPA